MLYNIWQLLYHLLMFYPMSCPSQTHLILNFYIYENYKYISKSFPTPDTPITKNKIPYEKQILNIYWSTN